MKIASTLLNRPEESVFRELKSLEKYRAGELKPLTKAEFEPVFKQFARTYNAHASHSMGDFPIPCIWSFKSGFTFQD